MQNKKNKIIAESGVALLFTVLMTSMLLLVALSISNVAFKELVFSGEARDSDKAFFAADTGIECALYLNKITTTSPAGVFDATTPGSGTCSGRVYDTTTGTVLGPTGTIDTYQFFVRVGSYCSQVTVDKKYDSPTDPGAPYYTRIRSIGFNVAAPTAGTTCVLGLAGERVVTRAIETKFKNP